ncbi:gliding motility-associated protein GldE [Capnocytophaga sputigena]|jgi:gliding motility-associated protein gldE|uniref:gliding motility-associated protein GldE n=1 Tax=Capnocytophaga sputigena TaxID=1019 RepID=UPI00288936B8|nr:gliding motility-associated protein GldE [Capnocytophaga sputigena]
MSFLDINWSIVIQFAVFVVLLLCSALISGAEVALFSLTPAEVNTLREEKIPSSNIIAKLVDNPKKLLATVLIANNLVNISIVLLFVDLGDFLFGGITTPWVRTVLDVGVVTFVLLLCGEILPKIYANRNNIQFAQRVGYFIYVLDSFFTPISAPMKAFTVWIQKRLGKQKSNISIGQLSQALELASEEDTTNEEKKILESIVSFGNTETREVMVPRVDIFALSEELSYQELLNEIVAIGYSRIPVYRENLDNITGVIYIKDLLPHLDKTDFDWNSVKRNAFFVPENKKLDDLLSEFQEKKIHLAVVVDEYGGTCGVITLEDIIEEIVGSINDEFDDDDVTYFKVDDDTFIFEGKTVLKDFYRILDFNDEEEALFDEKRGDAETLAGFLLEIAGNFPQKGIPILFSNYKFIVEAFDKKRIKQVKIIRTPNA